MSDERERGGDDSGALDKTVQADDATVLNDTRPRRLDPLPLMALMAAADAMPPSAGAPPAIVTTGQVLGGRYRLVRLLGAGGMGQVYKGEHISLGIPIAVKTMHPHVAVNQDDRRRFLREARAASLLKHPNVVQVLDVGEDGGLLYIVMELLDGVSLGAWLRQAEAPAPLREVAPILDAVLDALETAHACGIVHRDLKPENVLLTEVAGKRTVKVVDFGLAHLDDELDPGPTLTSRDMVAGTPEYMSPEQCRSLAVGPSTDLYAIGCMLTTMLQGKPPFSGQPVVETFSQHLFSAPPPLARPPSAEPVPPLLERLRLDLLAKTPERRPRSAAEVRARLAEALSPEAEGRRLPERKGGALFGSRMERVPAWTATDPALPPEPPLARSVALLELPAGGAVSQACATGLNAHGLTLIEVAGVGALVQSEMTVVVLDAGSDVEGACAMLAEIGRAAPGARVIVCASELGAERMNALVAAGAADVARHPVTPDVLGRKLLRVLRRGR